MAEPREDTKSKKKRNPIFFVGLGLIVLAAGSIAHFVISAALHGLPEETLSSSWNWLFIGGHAALGASGIGLIGIGARRSIDSLLPEKPA